MQPLALPFAGRGGKATSCPPPPFAPGSVSPRGRPGGAGASPPARSASRGSSSAELPLGRGDGRPPRVLHLVLVHKPVLPGHGAHQVARDDAEGIFVRPQPD